MGIEGSGAVGSPSKAFRCDSALENFYISLHFAQSAGGPAGVGGLKQPAVRAGGVLAMPRPFPAALLINSPERRDTSCRLLQRLHHCSCLAQLRRIFLNQAPGLAGRTARATAVVLNVALITAGWDGGRRRGARGANRAHLPRPLRCSP